MLYFPRHRLRPELAPDQEAYFHVVSRVVDRRNIFGPPQKAKFLEYMRRYESFCRVRIVGYCLMDDHFHLVIGVPGRPTQRPSQQELLDHVRNSLGQTIHDQYQDRVDFWTQQLKIGIERDQKDFSKEQMESPLDEILPSKSDLKTYAKAQLEKISCDIWKRMYDVSQFVFSLKQQFSHWYNKESGRVGTLWEERFRSTLLQPGPAVAEMVAYIDLNPVRAGLVTDAKEFAWSQYGAAAAGDHLSSQAIAYLTQKPDWIEKPATADNMHGTLPVPQLELPMLLMRLLLERRGLRSAAPGRLQLGYQIPARGPESISYVTGPIRSFVRGQAIGDSAYLEGLFASNRELFGPTRRSAARRIILPTPVEEEEIGGTQAELDRPKGRGLARDLLGLKALRTTRLGRR